MSKRHSLLVVVALLSSSLACGQLPSLGIVGSPQNLARNNKLVLKAKDSFFKSMLPVNSAGNEEETEYLELFKEEDFYQIPIQDNLVLLIDRDISQLKTLHEMLELLRLSLRHAVSGSLIGFDSLSETDQVILTKFADQFTRPGIAMDFSGAQFQVDVNAELRFRAKDGKELRFMMTPDYTPERKAKRMEYLDHTVKWLETETTKSSNDADNEGADTHTDISFVGVGVASLWEPVTKAYSEFINNLLAELHQASNDLLMYHMKSYGDLFGGLLGTKSISFDRLTDSMRSKLLDKAKRGYSLLGFESETEAIDYFKSATFDVYGEVGLGFISENKDGKKMGLSQRLTRWR